MNLLQLRLQLAIRSAWEHHETGSVSKETNNCQSFIARKIKTEADMNYKCRAIGNVIRTMNIKSIPVDDETYLKALALIDKNPELVQSKLIGLDQDSQEYAAKMAVLAVEFVQKHFGPK